MRASSAEVRLTGQSLTIAELVAVARDGAPAVLAAGVATGVATGLGDHARLLSADDERDAQQMDLLGFLSCGVGEPLPAAVIRGSMLLRANALSNGYSGVRPVVAERLLQLLGAGITPVTPRYGSVGAGGDLVPSAHIARVLLGLGEVHHRGQRMQSADALREAGIAPIALKANEGLALLNGTTVMTSIAALVLDQAEFLSRLILTLVALCGEVLKGTDDAFEPVIRAVEGHRGQIEAARLLRLSSRGSSLLCNLATLREGLRQNHTARDPAVGHGESIQSPYSLRGSPQGLGPALESIAQARDVIQREMNPVNDIPRSGANDNRGHHSGNSYGGHVARAMDGVQIDLANIANWGHALMAMLMDPRISNGLPPNLSSRPGANSGFQGMQLAQTALVVACRKMCTPSSIRTLPTGQYNQDIVSLGLHSALTAMEMTVLVRGGLSILSLALCQAADLRGVASGAERLGCATDRLYRGVRRLSSRVDGDRAMDAEIAALDAALAMRGIDLSVDA